MAFRVAILSTGGTIEKTYDDFAQVLSNDLSVLDVMLASLQLPHLEIVRVPLMNKDSLTMTPEDHSLIARTAIAMAASYDGVVVVHGTDRLSESGHRTYEISKAPKAAVVFTGAMRPYELRLTDAMQNLTESLLAVQILDPGVYVVMHGQVLDFPGPIKDHERGTFIKA